jgi:predicted DNA binding CopG/RHH family protein
MKRLTLDISKDVHRAIKKRAADEGVAMVDLLREDLAQKYRNL